MKYPCLGSRSPWYARRRRTQLADLGHPGRVRRRPVVGRRRVVGADPLAHRPAVAVAVNPRDRAGRRARPVRPALPVSVLRGAVGIGTRDAQSRPGCVRQGGCVRRARQAEVGVGADRLSCGVAARPRRALDVGHCFGFVRHGHLAERHRVGRGSRSHHAQATGASLHRADALAVDGDRGQVRPLASSRYPPPGALGEGSWVEGGEGPVEGLMTGDTVGEFQEAAEGGLLAAAVLGELLPAVGPADHGTRRDGRGVGLGVGFVGGLDPRVGSAGRDGDGRHRDRAPSVVPSGGAATAAHVGSP